METHVSIEVANRREAEWGEGESCKYSEATLKVFVTPDGGPAWRIQLWIGKWASAISAA